VSDNAQLLVYIRFFNEEKKENNLFIISAHIIYNPSGSIHIVILLNCTSLISFNYIVVAYRC